MSEATKARSAVDPMAVGKREDIEQTLDQLIDDAEVIRAEMRQWREDGFELSEGVVGTLRHRVNTVAPIVAGMRDTVCGILSRWADEEKPGGTN